MRRASHEHNSLRGQCKRRWLAAAASALFCAMASSSYGATWRVDATADLGGDGLLWSTAFKHLTNALENPQLAGGDEIWVAQGTYRPDQSDSNPGGSNNPSETFSMVPAVKLYGGFPTGGGNNTFQARNPEVYTTTLSGEIGTTSLEDNSFHVVTATEVGNSAVLNGFTISGGYVVDGVGGGILIESNVEGNTGPLVVRCKVTGNSAFIGGGVSISGFADPTFVNCSFIENSGQYGGAMTWKGWRDAHTTLVNCLFANNTAAIKGGALTPEAGPTITNCTFADNVAFGGLAIWVIQPGTIITNSILWGGAGQIDANASDYVTVNYSDVEGGWPGTENIDEDPLFVDSDAGNFRLRNECVDGVPVVSPCIDKGSDAAVPCDEFDLDEDGVSGCPPTGEKLPWDRDKETPVTHHGRVFNVVTGPGTKVDMGAYESEHIAAIRWDIASAGGDPPPDGVVGVNDFFALLLDWSGPPCPGCAADFNHDLQVATADQLDLLQHWCDPCTPCGGMAMGGGAAGAGESDGSGSTMIEAALSVMGFSGLEDYGAWLAQAGDAEAYASGVVLALLLGG